MNINEMDVYPHIEYSDRKNEVIYNELQDDGKVYSAESKMTWDNYDIELRIKIPMILSDERILEIFQGILDDLIKVKKKEHDNSIWRA